MRIAYVGRGKGTALQRARSLIRLGHEITMIDATDAVPGFRAARSWAARTGGLGLARRIEDHVLAGLSGRYDHAHVDSGELVGPGLVKRLRAIAPRVTNYMPDNPFSGRDGHRWRLYLKALPLYDMVYTVRARTVPELLEHGARAATRIWQTTDDLLQEPEAQPNEEMKARFRSPVSFVGTWMPERGPFLLTLIEAGVPLKIIGPRWDRAAEWSRLKPHTILGGLPLADYNAAVAAADISVALLSKANFDLHTKRSIEIPVLGSLLCGERTPDHLSLYDEGTEAVFWSSAEECARQCLRLIADPAERQRIASAGRARAIRNGHFNGPLMSRIIGAVT